MAIIRETALGGVIVAAADYAGDWTAVLWAIARANRSALSVLPMRDIVFVYEVFVYEVLWDAGIMYNIVQLTRSRQNWRR